LAEDKEGRADEEMRDEDSVLEDGGIGEEEEEAAATSPQKDKSD